MVHGTSSRLEHTPFLITKLNCNKDMSSAGFSRLFSKGMAKVEDGETTVQQLAMDRVVTELY
ncbi:hypothetical protein FRX31_020941 [Thalictrum thalictroides]|uniref:Uncharacterized protein n=1 Tax=Thalictrum thalictroides TaxID=46969 RepID=A0A7J6VWI3_THATH|nr:hypothetical protein FRX31_020941 [Thalictrum thalictroides]